MAAVILPAWGAWGCSCQLQCPCPEDATDSLLLLTLHLSAKPPYVCLINNEMLLQAATIFLIHISHALRAPRAVVPFTVFATLLLSRTLGCSSVPLSLESCLKCSGNVDQHPQCLSTRSTLNAFFLIPSRSCTLAQALPRSHRNRRTERIMHERSGHKTFVPCGHVPACLPSHCSSSAPSYCIQRSFVPSCKQRAFVSRKK